ncbi:uncharacterized protein [Palaemon carinicauda]|uniref:uncharacterized protein isoform X2 n=1 Tax=Palaemon carinicauda TaxID=392227 RepID=UPI0035B5AE9C
MVKLLLFPFALILAFASAQADDKFLISDANNTVNFTAAVSSYTVLASWTSDINNKITFKVFRKLEKNPQRLFTYIPNYLQSDTWNLFEIYRKDRAVIICLPNRRYQNNRAYSPYDLYITIKSTKKTYWRFCADIRKCDLPAPVPPATEFPVGSTTTQSSIVSSTTQSSIVSSTTQSSIVSSTTQSSIVSSTVPTPSTRETALNFTSIVLLSICCVLVAIVIGMAVYIIRGRRASLNEPGLNMNSEAIYEEVELPGNVSRAQQNHNFENVIYGAVIPRQA